MPRFETEYDMPTCLGGEDGEVRLRVFYDAEYDTTEGVLVIGLHKVVLDDVKQPEYSITREEERRLLDYLFENHEG